MYSFTSPLAIEAVSILLPPPTRLSLDALRVLCPAFSFASPLAIGADIYSIAAAHQAEPRRTLRSVLSFFFCFISHDWSDIYSIAAIHQAEPGSPLPLRSVLIRSPPGSRTALRVLRPALRKT